MYYVIVGEVEVYICTDAHIDEWLSLYRLYGVADTIDDAIELYHIAEVELTC